MLNTESLQKQAEREYGEAPFTPYSEIAAVLPPGSLVGPSNSNFQSNPFEYRGQHNWSHILTHRGLNPQMQSAVEEIRPDAALKVKTKAVEAAVYSWDFEVDLRNNDYERNGVNGGARLFEPVIDATTAEELISRYDTDPDIRQVVRGLSMALNRALHLRMDVVMRVNTLAGLSVDEASSMTDEELHERFVRLQAGLSDIFRREGVNFDAPELDGDGLIRVIEPVGDSLNLTWEEYVDSVAGMGANSIRFSAEWATMVDFDEESRTQCFKPGAVERVREQLRYARNRGLEPVICLQHFTQPLWLKDGWRNPETQDLFVEFSMGLLEGLEDDRPELLFSFNELTSVVPMAEIEGLTHPYHRSDKTLTGLYHEVKKYTGFDYKPGRRVYEEFEGMVDTHIRLYEEVDKARKDGRFSPTMQLGFTHITPSLEAWDRSPLYIFNKQVVVPASESFNDYPLQYFLKRCGEKGRWLTDILGHQTYCQYFVGATRQNVGANAFYIDNVPERFDPMMNNWGRRDLAGFETMMHVQGLFLEAAAKYGLNGFPEIMISETGMPTVANPIDMHVKLAEACAYAAELGVMKFRGILPWTPYDNLEWFSHYNQADFGYLDTRGRIKPMAHTGKRELDLSDFKLHRKVDAYLKRLRAYFASANGLDKEIAQAKLEHAEAFVAEHGKDYPRQTGLRATLMRYLSKSIPSWR
ncbi:MAG: Glycosyl hydrolase family 1 [candidate division WS6 bacterium OLB20]|uniref:Glycosyl hydrolase family 1 n=1 Tax=candidate division WS6 bacterium OLB20 TaxID=1617426 RepID=A0A136LVR3_9BACT|nr:MAG: Glycosyl hydrolase family 1 [candidate division WS6 bacterium OLB20]